MPSRGGRHNTCSILEAFDAVSQLTGKPMQSEYVEENRAGDHICYYSDLSKISDHYPEWSVSMVLGEIFEELFVGLGEQRSG